MRVFLIVLDSLGIGNAPDADLFGDAGANTLKRISQSKSFNIPNLRAAGLCNIDGVSLSGCDAPSGAYARLFELSLGKDTTVGHWEIAGLVSSSPLPTYPEGFPDEVIEEFSRATGRGVLANKPYSGTKVIEEFGEEHMRTGDLIVYTSADSVFQIAAHEDIVPADLLYDYCIKARRILVGKHGVGRVIARPFIGEPGSFTRTAKRRDFSLSPPSDTLLDLLQAEGFSVISVGKIKDIFADRGITESYVTHSNAEGMEKTLEIARGDFSGLCFLNLVDFDMLYGHRQDTDGYAAALSEFDEWLPKFLAALGHDDVVIISADHGCDPGDDSTDHTREAVPCIMLGERIKPQNLGTGRGFGIIARTVCDIFGIKNDFKFESFIGALNI